MINKDLVIIGGGSAGLAAAIKARQEGIKDILIIEKDGNLGGILNQCIHNGFGLEIFNEELTAVIVYVILELFTSIDDLTSVIIASSFLYMNDGVAQSP